MMLAGPGLLTASFLTGIAINIMLQHSDKFQDIHPGPECPNNEWPAQAGLMLGVILSATDPVAVVALLKDFGCKASLATVIEGESLLNDGTALVMFTILIKIMEGDDTEGWGDYIFSFCYVRLSFLSFSCCLLLVQCPSQVTSSSSSYRIYLIHFSC